MTIIAWDGATLAADSRFTVYDYEQSKQLFQGTRLKIKPISINGVETAFAVCGDSCVSHTMTTEIFFSWGTGNFKKYPKWSKRIAKEAFGHWETPYEGQVALYWPETEEWLRYDAYESRPWVLKRKQAWVMAGDEATSIGTGAMEAGADSQEAVRIVCQKLDYCGLPLYTWYPDSTQIRRVE